MKKDGEGKTSDTKERFTIKNMPQVNECYLHMKCSNGFYII